MSEVRIFLGSLKRFVPCSFYIIHLIKTLYSCTLHHLVASHFSLPFSKPIFQKSMEPYYFLDNLFILSVNYVYLITLIPKFFISINWSINFLFCIVLIPNIKFDEKNIFLNLIYISIFQQHITWNFTKLIILQIKNFLLIITTSLKH